MSMRSTLAACLLLCLAAKPASHAAPAMTEEVGPVKVTAPPGWVRADTRTQVAWVAADDPAGNRCRILSNAPSFQPDPVAAFRESWSTLVGRVRNNRPLPPQPSVQRAQGYAIASGAYSGPFDAMPWAYLGFVQIGNGDQGAAFAALGADAGCAASFSGFISKLTLVEGSPATTAGAQGSNAANTIGQFYNGMNQQEASRARQNEQERVSQDRIAQQRLLDQQNQQRQAQQRLIDQQNQSRLTQQRIQDAYRR